ncbi:hypothetical protein [Streptomyces rubellomurinus]|uniref:Uncharacterized protein n=1 Tax=Streptomyces sp. Y1 TaxID=3238634 RepID=A0AB39TGL6_9ACTN|nr:hypothetical protein [Streptomyces rubellomurinus]
MKTTISSKLSYLAGVATGVIAAAAALRNACSVSSSSSSSSGASSEFSAGESPARVAGPAGGIGCTPDNCPPHPGNSG